MQIENFFKTILFKEGFVVEDINNFSFEQSRLIFNDYANDGSLKFDIEENKYDVTFSKSDCFDLEKVPLLIPIRNMSGLLEYTITNLISNSADIHANIIVIDDRSDDSIQKVCSKYSQVSYIRCDYDSSFNYAMLANIGSYIAKSFGFKEVIFWNSDMYLPDDKTLGRLIAKHRDNKPVLSGTKLAFPYKNWKGESFGIAKQSGEMDYSKQGKVQFGGSSFLFDNNRVKFFHIKVGADLDNLYVNCDKGALVNTGAYTMADLDWLVATGGLNPSFAKIFNDVDLCLRALVEKKSVHYYGKDTYLYHEESTNMNSIGEEKQDHQFLSDAMLFTKVWDTKSFNQAIINNGISNE